MKYTTIDEVENYLLINIETSFQPQVVKWIEQVEKHIDQRTGRNFVADDEDTERKYDGDGTDKLLIDDFVSISKVEIDETEIDSEDYYFYPANSECKNRIELDASLFSKGRQNVKITGKWGYSVAVPDDIMFAATVLVSGIINFSNQAEGEVRTMSIGSYSVTYKDKQEWQDFERVADILKGYKKFVF